jgi:thioredoxin 1
MASDKVATFTDGNFESDVLKASTPVLVDFWAEWCGPCRAMGPTIDALAGDYGDKVSIGKLNVDENPSVTMRYMVRGIPTIMVFKGGEMVDQVVGLVDKSSLKQLVDKHLSSLHGDVGQCGRIAPLPPFAPCPSFVTSR